MTRHLARHKAALRFFCLAVVSAAALFLPSPGAAEDEIGGYCVSCHQVLSPKRLAGPVDECRGGLHESKGISCSGCHGGNPAEIDKAKSKSAAAGYAGVPSPAEGARLLCGKCHKSAYETWVSSGHNPGASCAACHGAHRIGKATLDLIAPSRCSGCHPFPKANPLKTYILEAETAVLSVKARSDRLGGEGMDVKKAAEGMALLNQKVMGMHHLADRGAIKAASMKIREEAGRLGSELAADEKAWRFRVKIIIGSVVISILAILTGSYFAVHRIKTRRMLGR